MTRRRCSCRLRRPQAGSCTPTGRSILVITYQLLSDPDARFADLGPDWHDRIAPLHRKRQLITDLERLPGMKVTLQEATA